MTWRFTGQILCRTSPFNRSKQNDLFEDFCRNLPVFPSLSPTMLFYLGELRIRCSTNPTPDTLLNSVNIWLQWYQYLYSFLRVRVFDALMCTGRPDLDWLQLDSPSPFLIIKAPKTPMTIKCMKARYLHFIRWDQISLLWEGISDICLYKVLCSICSNRSEKGWQMHC